jgi:hypothetical protein
MFPTCFFLFCIFSQPVPIVPDGQGGYVPFTNSRVMPDGSLRPYDPQLDGYLPGDQMAGLRGYDPFLDDPYPGQLGTQPGYEQQPYVYYPPTREPQYAPTEPRQEPQHYVPAPTPRRESHQAVRPRQTPASRGCYGPDGAWQGDHNSECAN